MWACILLHNWRTEMMGQNQIKKYFNNIDHINSDDEEQ